MLIKSEKINGSGIKDHAVPTFENDDSAAKAAQANEEGSFLNGPEDYLKQLAKLKSELKITKKNSYRDGLQAGEKAGYHQCVGLIQEEIEKFANLTELIRSRQEELVESSEQFVLSFALKIVEKIIGSAEFSTIRFDQDKLQKVVAESLKLFSDSTKYTLRLHRETSRVVEKYKTELLAKIKGPIEISIVDDSTLEMGDCVIESDYGVLDARIESQFAEIKNFFIK